MYVSSEAARVGAADAGPAHVLPPVKASRPMPKPATIIAALWAVGACLLAARLLISHAALWRTRRRSVPVKDRIHSRQAEGLVRTVASARAGAADQPRRSAGRSSPAHCGRSSLSLKPSKTICSMARWIECSCTNWRTKPGGIACGTSSRAPSARWASFSRCCGCWRGGWKMPAKTRPTTGCWRRGADVKAYASDLAIAAERFLLRRPESVAGLGVIRFRSSLGRRVTHVLDTSRNWVSSLSWRAIAMLCALTVVATVLTSAISCTGLATNAAVSAGEPAYVFTVIGENAFPAGLNNGGQVVGQLYGTPGHTKAFQWSQEEGIKDLGTLPPPADYGSSASAINDAGDIIGHSAERNNNWHPFVRSASLGMVSIPTLGGRQASPISVNASGQIVGWASRPDTLWRAFLFKPGKTIQDLGSVIGDSESQALAINAHGWIVGNASSGTGGRKDRMHPVLWIPGEPVKDLGLLPGTESGSAADINDSGEVVGSAGVYRDVSRSKMYCGRPFIWTPEKGTVALPMPDYDCVLATHINKHGQILIAAYNVAIRRPTEKGSSASVEGSLSPEPWQIEEGGQFLLNKGCLLECRDSRKHD